MKIHRIETGKVRVKKNQLSRAEGIIPKMAKVLFDSNWSDWLPIYAWVIEHDEGIFVVDTGETSKTDVNGYLPKWHPYYSMGVEFHVKPEEEIGPQLMTLGIDPMIQVSKVIMTHLHTDHAGGLYHFPNSAIIIDRKEYESAKGNSGILKGYLPHRWPDCLYPKLIDLAQSSFGPFQKSMSVTRDGAIRIVATPGHVPTHMSVIVKMEGLYYFLAGDTSYTEQYMLEGTPDGVGIKDESIITLKKIQQFTKHFPTIYLPSHDPDSARRMDQRIISPLYQEKRIYV